MPERLLCVHEKPAVLNKIPGTKKKLFAKSTHISIHNNYLVGLEKICPEKSAEKNIADTKKLRHHP